MKNEYGIKLDSNGYAPSIVQQPEHLCMLCYRGGDLVRHEVYHGSYRKRSKALGCWVTICPDCHKRVHCEDNSMDLMLKQYLQRLCMEHYGWDLIQFREKFGKNYLEVPND